VVVVAEEALAISQLTVGTTFIPEPTTAYLGTVDEFYSFESNVVL
jgi:hypothetical protein